MKERILRLNLYFGLLIFIFSGIFLIFHLPFMKTWFFIFAWWSFILIVDSLNFRKTKTSLLSQSFKDFLFKAFISVFVWLLFELFNLRLRNWTYHSLPLNFVERWLGFFMAFASVIPAMQEISLFFERILSRKFLRFQIKVPPAFHKWSMFLGVISIFLALSWPRIFLPLVWLCFIFFLEPLNYRLKNRTFLEDLERGEWRRLSSWLMTGLITGFLWEIWNFWAGAHWQYSLPYLNFWKVFEMPVLGYLGFLPFALEVFALSELLDAGYRKLEKRMLLKSLIFVLLLLFYAGCFYLIDTFSVVD